VDLWRWTLDFCSNAIRPNANALNSGPGKLKVGALFNEFAPTFNSEGANLKDFDAKFCFGGALFKHFGATFNFGRAKFNHFGTRFYSDGAFPVGIGPVLGGLWTGFVPLTMEVVLTLEGIVLRRDKADGFSWSRQVTGGLAFI
jgi:hypothetical protein